MNDLFDWVESLNSKEYVIFSIVFFVFCPFIMLGMLFILPVLLVKDLIDD